MQVWFLLIDERESACICSPFMTTLQEREKARGL